MDLVRNKHAFTISLAAKNFAMLSISAHSFAMSEVEAPGLDSKFIDSEHSVMSISEFDLEPCPSIELIIRPKEKDVGGFAVRRALPILIPASTKTSAQPRTSARRHLGPWVFLDHMGPVEFSPGPAFNVRPHPHIHLATVTFLFEGQVLHRDSLGSQQIVKPGDLNLMIAGEGIVHSEREPAENISQKRRLHGLQLWLALPEAEESRPPSFHHFSQAELPFRELESGAKVSVLMGEAYGLRSPVPTFSSTLFAEAQLPANSELSLPHNLDELGFYLAEGSIEFAGELIHGPALVILTTKGFSEKLRAKTASRIALLGGRHLGTRHMYWNFISSDPQAVERAKVRWREGRFPKVPGDDQEYIPLPD